MAPITFSKSWSQLPPIRFFSRRTWLPCLIFNTPSAPQRDCKVKHRIVSTSPVVTTEITFDFEGGRYAIWVKDGPSGVFLLETPSQFPTSQRWGADFFAADLVGLVSPPPPIQHHQLELFP